MIRTLLASRVGRLALLGWALAGLGLARAAVPAPYAAPPVAAVGTNTVADVELRVARPPVAPCVVPLFDTREFVGEEPARFDYAPPAGCKGPWAKVVIEADYAVSAGRQYDRTAMIDVGGVNLYFGTTMEPRQNIAPQWHVERDVTDYQSHLSQSHRGAAWLVNYVTDVYTGHVTGRARLLFYPAMERAPAVASAPFIAPLADAPRRMDVDTPRLATRLNFPANLERLYLDVLAEPQGADEFWYACVDDRLAGDGKQQCGGGAWREADVWVDGQRAGVVPLFPWIYTGGINPYLWFPAPGIQTLNFEPTRVNLTPFVGLLTDGRPHEIALTIHGLRRYFLVTGTVLGWQDAGSQRVNGALVRNTLAEPQPQVDISRLKPVGEGQLQGDTLTTVARQYEIAGWLQTSHGRVETRLSSSIRFANRQDFAVNGKNEVWRVDQATSLDQLEQVIDAAGLRTQHLQARWPLVIDTRSSGDEGSQDQHHRLEQGLWSLRTVTDPMGARRWLETDYTVKPDLNVTVDMKSHRSRKATGTSQVRLQVRDSDGGCYDRSVRVVDNAVASTTDACH